MFFIGGNMGKQRLVAGRVADPEQGRILGGDVKTSGLQVQLPMTQLGDLLGLEQPLSAAFEVGEDQARAQPVTHPVAQNQHVDRLADKVGGAGVKGAGDGCRILQAGDHHNRGVFAAGELAKAAAGGEAVHSRHDDVEQDQIRRLAGKQRQGLFAAGRFDHRVP